MLFAALIVPWFVNWDDYKASFEREAGRILGHPVHVIGSAKATILPSPSLTFTDVAVGDTDDPMMTVRRFEVTIELLPLIQGEIQVTSMRLDRPVVRVSADATGTLDWLQRSAAGEALEPDKVALADVQIADGTLAYADARTGVAHTFDNINATVEAVSLAGPWRAEGSYLEGGVAVPFRFATGRRLDDRTIRLKGDVSPAQWPVSASADGVVRLDPDGGLAYAGTYSVTEVVDAQKEQVAGNGGAQAAAWRSEGAFTLSRDRLVIDKAVLSNGPVDRPTSLAGSLTLDFGPAPSFSVTAESRQLDLDRAFGGGPDRPIEVAAAANALVAWLADLPVPPIPGRVAFHVPGIVVGGSVIQDVAFTAEPAADGWNIDGLRARLPGQASLSADGMLATGKQVGFSGDARLAVVQPSTFASWWRGRAQQGAGRQLSAFDIAGSAVIGAGRVSLDDIRARIGDATITGRIAWSENARDHRRDVGTDLKADRIDFVQVKALADLLVGRSLNDVTSLADSFSVLLKTDVFQFDDVRLKDVSVDVGFADDRLTVTRIDVGDIGGASFRATSGRIDGLTTKPQGLLEATLEARTLDGLALLAGKLAPGSGVLQWLGRASPSLVPAVVKARITAPAEPDGTGIRIAIENGVAGSTTFDMDLRSTFRPDWRSQPAELSVSAHSPDSADLARLIGLAAVPAKDPQGADIVVHADGIPDGGLDMTVEADLAGLAVTASGELALPPDGVPGFTGPVRFRSGDLDPFIATAGLAIPGHNGGTKLDVDGTLAVHGSDGTITWRNGVFGDRAASGSVAFSRPVGQGWRIDGDLAVDTADFDWLLALGLGVPPMPDFAGTAAWAKTPFAAPVYGPVSGKLAVAADRLVLGDNLDVTSARLAVALQPQRIDVDLAGGSLRGAAASGGVSIHNVDGNANLAARFNLQGAPLEAFIWQRDGRAVGTGTFDLSANVEATGSSPAALVSSMTGGGVLAVRDGEARYINPNSARLVIRASDLDQEFSDAALRMTLAERIDADSLKFGETGGAFSIAAGAARLKGLAVRTKGVEGTGDTVLDLNTFTLESDWTLTFDPGDTKVEGTRPQIGVIFRGPLAAPSRMLDILPFSAYLNTRREARILEILATEEADRLEHERFSRLMVKLRQDRERTEREAREAAEAEARRVAVAAASVAAVARLHVEREIAADERAATVLSRIVEQTAKARDAAVAAAADAAKAAADAHASADGAAAALKAAITDDENAVAALAEADHKVRALQAAASESGDVAAKAATEAEAAEHAAAEATDAEAATASKAGKAADVKKTAEASLMAATAKAEEAARAAADAEAENTRAQGEAEAAGKVMAEAVKARDAADAALVVVETALKEAEAAAATIAKGSIDELRADAAKAVLERDAAERTAKAAVAAAEDAENRRDAAKAELERAQSDATTAEAKLATAEQMQAQQESLSAADAQDADAAELAQRLARQALARKAEADRTRQSLQVARSAYENAESVAADAAGRAGMAQEALRMAAAKASQASAAAEEARAGNTAALQLVADRTAARDAARREADARREASQQSGAAFTTADAAVRAATDRAVQARAAARIATAERAAAAADVATAVSAASDAAFELESAKAARDAADANAAKAREAANAAREVAHRDAKALEVAVAEKEAAEKTAAEMTARREAAERLVAETATAVERADAAAADADAVAAEKIADAQVAATRAGISQAPADAPVPTPRPRRQPLKIVPDALAGDAPLLLVPPN